MHIIFVTASYPRFPGGGSKVIYEHASRLASRGHDVEVVHPLMIRHAGVGRALDIVRNKVRDVRYHESGGQMRWAQRDPRVRVRVVDRLERIAEMDRPDVYVATYWLTSQAILDHGLGAPTLQFMQAFESWAAGDEEIERVWRLPWDKAVVSSSLYGAGLDLGVPANLLHRVPNGLDLSTYHPRVPVSGRSPHVAFLAHTAPVKGLDTALEVSRLIHEAEPSIPITAFGGGRRPARLPSNVDYVRALTGRALADAVYDKCSVFLCTSRREGWGYPAMEAMACGAALVSTDNGGVTEFSEPGVSSVIGPVDDAWALASAALRLLKSDEERERIARAGVESVRQFTWESSSAAFEAALCATAQRQVRGT